MLTLGYAVSGLSLSGSAPAGRQSVHLSVGHLPLAHATDAAYAGDSAFRIVG
jgi:hypothetical protein